MLHHVVKDAQPPLPVGPRLGGALRTKRRRPSHVCGGVQPEVPVRNTYYELNDELQELLKPRQHLLLVAAEHRVQDVRHLGQDVDVVLVLMDKRLRPAALLTTKRLLL